VAEDEGSGNTGECDIVTDRESGRQAGQTTPPGKDFYAHSIEGKPRAQWHKLEDHLRGTAEKARAFASAFGAGDWGYLAGLWHDVGKYSQAFQDYLERVSHADPHIADGVQKTDHSSAGAQHASGFQEIVGHLLAYAIAGHHAGLLNGRDTGACQEARLAKLIEPWQHGLKNIEDVSRVDLPEFVRKALVEKDSFCVGFFTRMIYSSLVDADFLDTEAFLDPDRSASRPRGVD
jgi:CRISPR-associated endonuclease/helicase Cas3